MINDESGKVRILFDLTLANMAALWTSAAEIAATEYAMTNDEITETFGPCEDPDASACAMMLFNSVVRWSGAIDAITITVVSLDEKAVWSADMLEAPERLGHFRSMATRTADLAWTSADRRQARSTQPIDKQTVLPALDHQTAIAEALHHLVYALSMLDVAGCEIEAAYVDHAINNLHNRIPFAARGSAFFVGPVAGQC